MTPLLSIVTISYNQAPFLKEAIHSVTRQDYTNIEHVVVDAGSTDGSREWLSEYADRLRLIFEPDHGPADGLNRGFEVAKGEVFYFLNSDDILLPGAAARAVEVLQDADVLLGGGVMVDASGEVIRPVVSTVRGKRSYALGIGSLFQQGMFFRADAYAKTSGFNIFNRTCWDAELLLNLLAQGAECVNDNFAYGGFRIHAQSITGSGRLNKAYIAERKRLRSEYYDGPSLPQLAVWAANRAAAFSGRRRQRRIRSIA